MTAHSDIPQGTLDLLILTVLAGGPCHCYAIAQRLRLLSRDVVAVRQSSLYPALHRLENRRLLAAEWRISDTGREAKYYQVTRRGRAQFRAEREGWRRLADAVGAILRSAEAAAS
jgi:PadR family transcriptional regulator, regulatory protein PadR